MINLVIIIQVILIYIENFDNINNSESINYNPSIKNINNKITNITIIIFFLSISFLLFYKN